MNLLRKPLRSSFLDTDDPDRIPHSPVGDLVFRRGFKFETQLFKLIPDRRGLAEKGAILSPEGFNF